MSQKIAASAMYGQLRLIRGACYRVVAPFRDYDCKLHPVGEEFVFLAVDVLPYDSGHTFSIRQSSGVEGVLRLQWLPESQEKILEDLHEYLASV